MEIPNSFALMEAVVKKLLANVYLVLLACVFNPGFGFAGSDAFPLATGVPQEGIAGDWQSECDGDGENTYLLSIAEDGAFTLTQYYYAFHDCVLVLGAHVRTGHATMSPPDSEGIQDIDIYIDQLYEGLLAQFWVDYYNKNKDYGYDDWQLEVFKPILYRKDRDGNIVKPYLTFGSFRINGDELTLAKFSDSKHTRSRDQDPTIYRRL